MLVPRPQVVLHRINGTTVYAALSLAVRGSKVHFTGSVPFKIRHLAYEVFHLDSSNDILVMPPQRPQRLTNTPVVAVPPPIFQYSGIGAVIPAGVVPGPAAAAPPPPPPPVAPAVAAACSNSNNAEAYSPEQYISRTAHCKW